MNTNDQLEGISTADLGGVTGGGVGDWISKAKDKVVDTVRDGVEYFRQNPHIVGTGQPLRRR